jgi:hypothetical protein
MIYIQKENSNGKLVLDNIHQNSGGYTALVCQPKAFDYYFGEIEILRGGKLNMISCAVIQSMTLQITAKLSGDGSGTLRVGNEQNVYLSMNNFEKTSPMKLQSNIHIQNNGLVHLPENILLTDGVNVHVAGSLTGVKTITVAKNGKFTALYPGSTFYRAAPGVFEFDTLYVQRGGIVESTDSSQVKLNIDLLRLDYGAAYRVPSRVVTTYGEKLEQSRGPTLTSNLCPYGTVHYTSDDTKYNPCGEGKWSSVSAPVPYQVVMNISDIDGIYRLVNVTKYHENYNITCDYTDYRLLPGQNCVFKPGMHRYGRLEVHSEATMSFEADPGRVVMNTLHVEHLRIYASGNLRALPVQWSSGLSSGVGGSYGGVGGRGSSSDVHGAVVLPESYGVSGGGFQGGGGQLKIRVAREFIHDGVVDVSGISTNTGGGGSGGSLLILAQDLKGTGVFKVNGGGSAGSNSGGGGGGRIGIHINSSAEDFQGQYEAYGGNGFYRGASGTIYIYDRNSIKGMLTVQGQGSQSAFLPSNTTLVEIDSLYVGQSATFQVSVPQLTVNLLRTDGSGKIVIPTGYTLTIMELPSDQRIACELDVIGILDIQVPVMITSTVNLRGIIKTSRLTIAKRVNFIWTGGELKTKSVMLREYSVASISGLSKVNIDEIHVGPYAKIEVSDGDFMFLCKQLIFDAHSVLLSKSELKSFNITSSTLEIHNFASIGVSGGGYVQGPGYHGRRGVGASHGGQGAGATKNSVYGSVFEANEFGSGSLDSSGGPHRGGGRLAISVTDVLHVDGVVHADGFGSQQGGGGSGGSLMIKAKLLKGSGVFRANGMSGGSGGRIAVYVEDKQAYSGVVSSFGGCTTTCGAAGTVFIREYLIGLQYETTIVNNDGRSSGGITSIMHGTQADYTLQKLRITQEGRVEVVNPSSNITVNINVLDLEGDFTGQLRVLNNQRLSLGSSSVTGSQPFVLRCAVSVEVGAELTLAPRVFVKKTTLRPCFDVFGKVQGGQELIIGRNALVSVSPEGVIGTKSSKKGILTFREIHVLSGGHIVFNHGGKSSVEVRAVSINIEYSGILESPLVLLKTPELNIQMGARVVSNGLGYRSGPGVGGLSGFSLWDGGSYGGCGGGFTGVFCPIYGSMFGSIEPGSGGGAATGSNGGQGGGVIVLEVGTLLLDGEITTDGGNGQGNAGGGSGGSVHMTIGNVFSGRGTVRARGGKSGIEGGGGGGGRIYINSEGIDNFKGDVDARGGVGVKLTSGSPGTIWLLQNKKGLTTKTLILDNKDISLTEQLPVVLNETVSRYYFDVLHLVGSIILTPDHHMIIEKLVTSPLSTISVPNGLIVEIDTNSRATSPECSLHVAKHGELRLASSVTFLGPDNQFSGTITGVIDMIIGEGRRTVLSASARTALFVDGNYTFISKRGEYKFASLLLKSNAMVSFEKSDMTEVPLVFATLELRYGSVLQGGWLNIQAVSILVHSGAKMDLSERGHPGGRGDGRGIFNQNYGGGGGHAGIGGGEGNSGGEWYGDMVTPNSLGSGGGGRVLSQGGKGGGYLNILTSEELVIDGSILVSGGDCTMSGCGGGSGGSIYIRSRSLDGVGLIGARGGNADNAGGGGSGGRVALHLSTKMLFQGDFEVHGGTGKYNGASGTVYIEDNKGRLLRRIVIVDNYVISSDTKPTTVLTNNVDKDVTLDELEVQGPVSVSFFNKNKISNLEMDISVAKLSAGTRSEIVIQANQVMFSETSESEETSFILRTNLVIQKAGLFVTASKLFVDGAELTVNGRLMNVRHFTLETGSRVTFSEKSQTGIYLKPFGPVFLSLPGTQLFGSFTLKSGSTFSAPENLRIQTADMIVKNGVVIGVRDLEIAAATLTLERGTLISADDVTAGGHGSGSSTIKVGSGGSYASPGGKNQGDTSYGSLFKPQEPGSEGGAGSSADTAGKGGGVIIIKATLLQLDGKITVNGGDGDRSSNAGGGSGGSIYLKVDNLVGKGEIIADGGRGDGGGSCGSGGRIGISLTSRYTYSGSIRSASLDCGSTQLNGGPGTIFISEIKNKRTYTRLILDNRFSNQDTFVTLNESQLEYDFDEIMLRGGASLQLLKQPNIHQRLSVGLLSGDRSGFIHVHRNQTVIISERTPARVPVSFKVDDGGLVVVPHSVIIVGHRRYSIESRGTILGMRNMELARDRVVRFYESSILGIGKDKRDFTGSEGVLEFGSLILHTSSIIVIDDIDQVKIFADNIDIKYNASLISSSLAFTVSSLHVEIGGRIDCSGHNDVIGSKSAPSGLAIGTGAGHGSEGGEGTTKQGGPYHGSLYNPTERGRTGGAGPNSEKGGQGGGSLVLRVGSRFIVDGIITVSGGRAVTKSNAGGGSGGSIYVSTHSYRGYGVMDVRGGASGGTTSGSGAGGRIAIYSEKEILYRGGYQASGGKGTQGRYGGPGTMFVRYLRNKRFYTQLRFGERQGNNLVFVTLDEKNITEFIFNEVIIERRTAVRLKQDGEMRSLKVDKLTGDGTGYIYVGGNHTFYLRGSTGQGEVSKPPVNLDIDTQGTGVLDTSLFVVSHSPASPNGHALRVNGRIIGVEHLYLTRERKMVFMSKAQTVGYNNGSLTSSSPGTFVLATLETHDRAQLSFLTSHGMRGLAGKIDVKFGAKVFADQFDMSKYELVIFQNNLFQYFKSERYGSAKCGQPCDIVVYLVFDMTLNLHSVCNNLFGIHFQT